MELRLDRLHLLPDATLGSLWIRTEGAKEWEWECFTKEAHARSDRVFIAGESALPIGLYTVSLAPSKKFGRVVPLLVSAQLVAHGGHRVALGMRMIPGHHLINAEAGILVGQEQGAKEVHRTRAAYDQLYPKLALAVSQREAIEMEITQ